MPEIRIKEIEYGSFGKCVEISNGNADIVVTVDVGPRIIRFGLTGRENEFCDDGSFSVPVGNEEWHILGGHRLWHSPEAMPRSYSPDNKPVHYEKIENGIRVTQETEPWVQIKKQMDITMAGCCNKVQIIHRLTNENAWPIEVSAWAITVMAAGGLQVVPQPSRDTGLLANRLLSLWPYTKMNDHRVYWGDRYITLKQDPDTDTPFKFGIPNEGGWAAYFNHGNLFIKRFRHVMGAVYPDYGVSYETYTNDYMMEMESLSPLTRLEPGDTINHLEEWELIENVSRPAADNEEDIQKVVKCCIEGCGGCRQEE
ncbi:MAG: hypothetical protein ACOX27_01330 [Caldicoprobacterales bacterium]|jgi:hypothetical protein|nr:hypothetical protein [Clostridiales bacterium]